MKDVVREIRNRLYIAEQEDGHLSRRDCWTLLYEIFALRKTIEEIYEHPGEYLVRKIGEGGADDENEG